MIKQHKQDYSSQRGIAPLLLILILALLAGGGAYVAQKKGIVDIPMLRKLIISESEPLKELPPIKFDAQVTIPKTNIVLRYPKNGFNDYGAVIREDSILGSTKDYVSGIEIAPTRHLDSYGNFLPEKFITLSATYYKNPNNKSLSEYIDGLTKIHRDGGETIGSALNQTINGHDFFTWNVQGQTASWEGITRTNDGFLVVDIIYAGGEPNAREISEPIFEQILRAIILPSKSIETSPSPAISMSGWKTYRNEKYGFEVKYPNSMLLKSDRSYSYGIYDGVEARFEDQHRYLDIGVNSPPKVFEGAQEYDKRKIKIGTREIDISLLDFGGEFITTGFVFDASNIFFIKLGCEQKNTCNASDKNLFDEIITTVKFTNIPNETSNWKTYHNEKYGFEFKYPPDMFLLKDQFLITESVAFADNQDLDSAKKVFSINILKDYNKEHLPLLTLISKNIPESRRPYTNLNTRFGINGVEAVFISDKQYPQHIAVDFTRGSDVFEFWPSAPPESTSKGVVDKTILENIVKTFKFTK